MNLEQYLLINREWSYNNTIDQQGMKLEKQLLINMEWSSNKNNWSTGNEVKGTTIDQQGMKLEHNYWSTAKVV